MKKLIFLLFLLSLTGTLFSGYWVDPMVVNPDSIGFWWGSDNVSMTWDSTGRVWVSWVSDTFYEPYFENSVVKTCFYNGENWIYPCFLHIGQDTTYAYNNFNSMITDKDGNAWIIWHHGGFPIKKNRGRQPSLILYSIFSDCQWSEQSVIWPPPTDIYANFTALNSSIDTSGMIWVSWVLDWYDMHNLWFWQGLYSAHSVDSTWQNETVQDDYINPYLSKPAFVTELSGIRIFYAYEESLYFPSDSLLCGIKTACNTGGGWSNYESIYEDTNVSYITNDHPTAEIDTAGRQWVVWQHTGDLYAKYRETGIWSDLKIITSGSQPSMKTDGYGRTWLIRSGPHISYLEDTSFTIFQYIGPPGGFFPELGCDVMGNIWAVWRDGYKVYASFYRRDTISPQIAVVYPNGGEIFNFGETDTIQWLATDEDTVVWVNIYFSSDGGNSYGLISDFEKNDSAYEWTIPNVKSDSCLIKITAIDKGYNAVSDESDSFFTIIGTGISEDTNNYQYSISNYQLTISPNPFKERVEIKWTLGTGHSALGENPITNDQCPMTISIYDVSGRVVRNFSLLPFNFLLATTVEWDGRDDKGNLLPPGVYFAKLSAGDFTSVKKMLLIR
ncbi:MAG: T9SS type A sorting domain-containing protein [Candidatus Cloacimonadota bacterium]|nr:MAG: T9SS type A sorting domain-containing protein [Candidatus Cloacimonadota bacterium]